MKFTKEQFDAVFARYKADYDAASAALARHLIENDTMTFVFVAAGVQAGMVRPSDVRVFSVIYDCIREAGHKIDLSPDAMMEVKQQFAADKQAFIESEIDWLDNNIPLAFELVATVPYDSLLAVMYLAIARRSINAIH